MQCITGFLHSTHAGVEVPKTKDKTDTGTDCERTTGSIGTRKGENTRESHTGSTRNRNGGGELLGLTWDDVDFRKREISVNKTLVYIKDKETKKYVFKKYQTPKTKKNEYTDDSHAGQCV